MNEKQKISHADLTFRPINPQKDIPAIMVIEKANFEFAWERYEWEKYLDRNDCKGFGVEYQGQIIGFAAIEIFDRELAGHKKEIEIDNFAVSKDFQRKGVGSFLFGNIQQELEKESSSYLITLMVRESNINALKFFG